jgi:hypothetical protein
VLRWALAFIVLLLPSTADAKRVALVIGNSTYLHAGTLANPKNDATDVAAALKKLGFEAIVAFDLDKTSFDRKVREFAAALSGAEAGVFFYAGHGLQVAGRNYLMPVDAKLIAAEAVDFETVPLDVVHRVMERQANTNILFLDACRNNPLARNLARAMGTRSTEIARGLAPVESGVGTLISFSTQPGNVALDGSGRNSPFASALIGRLTTSADDLSAILIDVRNDVRKATDNKQVPWEHSSLTGRFYFRTPPATATVPRAPPPPTLRLSEAAEAWSAAKDTTSVPVLEDFVVRYKDTFYAGLARARIEELKRAQTIIAKADSAPKEAITRPSLQLSRGEIRDALYRTIMEHMSKKRSSRNEEQTASENYHAAPRPRALAVCIDWTKTMPTVVSSGGVTGAYSGRGNTGCRGLSSDECGRYARERCHNRGLCSARGQKCVLVDINGRNVLTLDEAWVKQFAQ